MSYMQVKTGVWQVHAMLKLLLMQQSSLISPLSSRYASTTTATFAFIIAIVFLFIMPPLLLLVYTVNTVENQCARVVVTDCRSTAFCIHFQT
jgi:hypothetical protein